MSLTGTAKNSARSEESAGVYRGTQQEVAEDMVYCDDIHGDASAKDNSNVVQTDDILLF